MAQSARQTIVAKQIQHILLIHGGAGDVAVERHESHRIGTVNAYIRGLEEIEAGRAGLDIIVSSLTVMENSGSFDAGAGSVLNELGFQELDAGLMEGATLKAGAVAALPAGYNNPSQIALEVLKSTNHVLLAGVGAEKFAIEHGFERQIRIAKHEQDLYDSWKSTQSHCCDTKDDSHDTVGAVYGKLMDNGLYDLYAGTTTGGMRFKLHGRVGDSPIIGSGYYADNETAAISTTGFGEAFMRLVAAKSVCDRLKYCPNKTLVEAMDDVLNEMRNRLGSDATGGMIGIDKFGNTAARFTTADMSFCGQCECSAVSH